jgi:hypothetical protein
MNNQILPNLTNLWLLQPPDIRKVRVAAVQQFARSSSKLLVTISN